ncbi:MAG: hypothetical protein KJ884_11690 [Gammaproteobacteria bacterium]|nr:hypothetical protein [Gammaproteobacteria bacterium]MBU1488717.1 hypothetical protein [Gammaproteobacteria bacterium]MBU2067226.1 hypothetical protein [Gammaproteobacteria bacterium]MBU2138822.1 hypothetical protein [Gammaproteobacteria bacterium]MBU2217509.1 hypothetical protein [Gammaproteobacteria bacterium]
MIRLALSGIAAVVILNLLLRTFVRLGGPLTTLVIAAAVAAGMTLWFNWRQARRPEPSEGWQLVVLYGGGLGLLYIGLLGMMLLKDEPSPMGLLILAVHYICYPLCAWLAFVKRF